VQDDARATKKSFDWIFTITFKVVLNKVGEESEIPNPAHGDYAGCGGGFASRQIPGASSKPKGLL